MHAQPYPPTSPPPLCFRMTLFTCHDKPHATPRRSVDHLPLFSAFIVGLFFTRRPDPPLICESFLISHHDLIGENLATPMRLSRDVQAPVSIITLDWGYIPPPIEYLPLPSSSSSASSSASSSSTMEMGGKPRQGRRYLPTFQKSKYA